MVKEEHTKSEKDDTMKNIQTLIDESIQIYELDKEQDNVIDELYNSLKIISSYLNYSVDINPEVLNMPSDTKILLTPMLDIMITKSDKKLLQKRIVEFSLDEVTNIMNYLVPKLTELAQSEKASKNKKITYLHESVRKLSQLKTLEGKPSVSEPSVQMEDLK